MTLDDIARHYAIPEDHPDILTGKVASTKDFYMRFMSLWDTQVGDGVITFDEFCDYFRDISACIETDAEFKKMMETVWKL